MVCDISIAQTHPVNDMFLRKYPILVLAALAIAGTGCDSNSTKDTATVSLSAGAFKSAASKAGKAGDTIEITAAKFLIKSIRFQSSTGDDSLNFHSESTVAILGFDRAVSEIAVEEVDLGEYDAVSFLVHKPAGNETPSDPDFSTGGDRYSAIIEGLYNGAPFVYRSAKTFHQLVAFPTALVVDDTPSTVNVTLQLDLGQWFVGNNGADLDPTDLSNGNVAQIDKSIRDSFRAFEDTNRDGFPD